MFALAGHASFALREDFIRLRVRDAFVEILVAHHHGRGAATGEALDELDGELPVLGRLDAVLVPVEAELGAEICRPVPAGTSGKT